MKKLSLLLVVFSLGLFALGCEKSETDVVAPDASPTTPDVVEDDMTDVETDIDVTAPDATAPDATAPDATAPDATAPDATAPEGDAAAPDAAAPGTEG